MLFLAIFFVDKYPTVAQRDAGVICLDGCVQCGIAAQTKVCIFNTSEPKLNVLFSQSSCVNEVGCVRTELSPRDETVFAIL